jgi:hypothetical protein
MYIRPETLTLLYIAVFLAVLVRWDRRPWLAYALPPTQALWVNSQGLFVFGPILLGFALIDSLMRVGTKTREARRWWRIVGLAAALTGLACLANPYGLRGALYPLSLLKTMGNPVFKESIAELMSLQRLIDANAGHIVFMAWIQIAVILLAAASFLEPLCWSLYVRWKDRGAEPAETTPRRRRKKPRTKTARAVPLWRLSSFRLLLFGAFTALSLQATRNSHQFAAVVGTLTAWNLGEWAAAVRARRVRQGRSVVDARWPRVAALASVVAALGLVG